MSRSTLAVLASTSYAKFGRLKLVVMTLAFGISSVLRMSDITLGVAVAVSAKMGLRPMAFMAWRSMRYSGLKSWPHSEIQWASSMA